MKRKEKIIIQPKKKYILFGLLGSTTFTLIGCLMIFYPDLNPRYAKFFVSIWGYIGTGFFGFAVLYFSKKIFDKKPELILDEDGLYNNSSIISEHIIKWDELNGVGITRICNEKILFLYLKDDKNFIKRFKYWEQLLMRLNLSFFGSPIGLSTRSLKCDLEQLNRQIQYRIKNWAQHLAE